MRLRKRSDLIVAAAGTNARLRCDLVIGHRVRIVIVRQADVASFLLSPLVDESPRDRSDQSQSRECCGEDERDDNMRRLVWCARGRRDDGEVHARSGPDEVGRGKDDDRSQDGGAEHGAKHNPCVRAVRAFATAQWVIAVRSGERVPAQREQAVLPPVRTTTWSSQRHTVRAGSPVALSVHVEVEKHGEEHADRRADEEVVERPGSWREAQEHAPHRQREYKVDEEEDLARDKGAQGPAENPAGHDEQDEREAQAEAVRDRLLRVVAPRKRDEDRGADEQDGEDGPVEPDERGRRRHDGLVAIADLSDCRPDDERAEQGRSDEDEERCASDHFESVPRTRREKLSVAARTHIGESRA